MLGSPLRCAQSSDSAGLSPQGFLSFLGFEERNLRAQHPQLLEGHCKGHREGTERAQRGGSSEQNMGNVLPLWVGTVTLQERGGWWDNAEEFQWESLSCPHLISNSPWAVIPLLCKYLMPSSNIVQPNTSQVIVLLQPSFHGESLRNQCQKVSNSKGFLLLSGK